MKLEGVGAPFTYKWPGGEVRLEPGKPIDLSPERAAKLIAKVPGRVRLVERAETVVIESEPNDDYKKVPVLEKFPVQYGWLHAR